jgi:hypothetical protein
MEFGDNFALHIEISKCLNSSVCQTEEEIDRAINKGIYMVPLMQSNFVDNEDFTSPIKSRVESRWG